MLRLARRDVAYSAVGNNNSVDPVVQLLDPSGSGSGAGAVDNVSGIGLNNSMDGPYPSGYSWVRIILASIVVTVIMILIIFGNTLVIVAIAKDRNLKGLQNWFIASLAVSDLFVGLLVMPFSLATELMGYWAFGRVLCDLWLAVDVLLCTASILNLCLISLDRYWSITRAISYVKERTKNRVIIMIVLVWLLSMIICLPPLVGWKRPQPTVKGYAQCILTNDIGYVLYSTLGSFYIPLVILIFVYFKIYLAARARARKGLKNKAAKQPQAAPAATGRSDAAGKNSSSNGANNTHTTSFSKHGCAEDDDEVNELSSDASAVMATAQREAEDEEDTRPAVAGQCKPLLGNADQATDSEAQPKNSQNLAPNNLLKEKVEMKKINFSDTDTDTEAVKEPVKTLNYRNNIHCSDDNLKPLLLDTSKGAAASAGADNGGAGVAAVTTTDNNKKPGARNLLEVLKPVKNSTDTRPTRSVIKEEKKRDDPERQKRRIAKARERRATIVLGIVMATFILCWLPFFSIYVIDTLFRLDIRPIVFAVFFWAGYCNSALNPLIYTVFNQDFRQAFARLLFGRRAQHWK